MDAQLWRLAWALPLVIVLGVSLIYWLKKLGLGGVEHAAQATSDALVLNDTPLTAHTRVLTVRVGPHVFTVFESTQHIQVHPSSADMGTVVGFPWHSFQRRSR